MKKNITLSLFLVFLWCVDCQKSEPVFASDASQTVEDALNHGCPSIEKEWSPLDYTTFDYYLSKIKETQYPRYKSSNSGAIFQKIINSITQPLFRNHSIDLNSRLGLILQMQQSLNSSLKRYVAAHNSGTAYPTELAYLLGCSLVVASQMLDLVDEFIPTIDPNDGKYEVRMHGLKEMLNGIAGQIDGYLLSLSEVRSYSDKDRKIMADYLLSKAPGIISRLNPSVQKEFRYKIARLIKAETHAGIRKLLERLYEKLNRIPSING